MIQNTVHSVRRAWYLAKSGTWISATQFSLSIYDLTSQVSPFPALHEYFMRYALLLLFSMLFLFLARDWFPVGTHYLHIFELSLISSTSFRYIYISSLALFPSSAYFQALFTLPEILPHRSWSWQSAIQYLCLPATSRADVLSLQGRSSPPHQNQHPRHWFSAHLCFCSSISCSNKQ